MKKLLFVLTVLLFYINSFAQTEIVSTDQNGIVDSSIVLYPTKMQSKVDQIVTTLLSRYHYKKIDLDDSLSSVIFDDYIKTLDYNKLYFLKSDIDRFEEYRYSLDDYLKEGILFAPFEMFDTFKKRMTERMYYIVKRLNTEFDYTSDDILIPNRENAEWATTTLELDDLWRKRLKNDALNKKLAKEDWEKTSDLLRKRYQRFHKVILQYVEEDVFQIYMNSFANAIDPHTSYFSPITSENFNISMSLSFEGIGASLMVKDDYTTIARIIPGGPAAKSENLFENDRIVAVGQDEGSEMVDVVGWRLDNVVKMIRGKKGTMVRLAILRADATLDMPTEEVKLIRDKIKLEEQAASSQIINVEEEGKNYKLGVIEVPAFYIDFEAQRKGDPEYRSTTRDVKKLISDLNQENVDGLIIDLRSNGGGSLQEAVELTGLFIKEGPVVQVRGSDGKVDVEEDQSASQYFGKPMAVLINRYSASASEIFAGAIQDYGRGIIIGEQSYGKGTVQNLIDLNRFMPTKSEDLGKLKITIAKFYRVTGSSTQKLGVMPDVEFPSLPRDDFGEESQPSALRWDQINPTYYQRYDDLSPFFVSLIEKHEKRILDNLEFQYLKEDIEEYEIRKNKIEYSLNENIRAAEREEYEARKEKRKEQREKFENLVLNEKEEVQKPNIRIDDPLLEETGFILADLMLIKNGK